MFYRRCTRISRHARAAARQYRVARAWQPAGVTTTLRRQLLPTAWRVRLHTRRRVHVFLCGGDIQTFCARTAVFGIILHAARLSLLRADVYCAYITLFATCFLSSLFARWHNAAARAWRKKERAAVRAPGNGVPTVGV